MEKDDNFWEQPQDLILEEEQTSSFEEENPSFKEKNENGSQTEQTLQKDIEANKSEAKKGVPDVKFKSVEALYDAYANLQKEFTKKCQRLAELDKDKISDEVDTLMEQKYREFLSTNGEATEYGDEIKRRLSENSNLKKMDDPFSLIWAEMLLEKLKSPSKVDEPLINDYILKNDSIKDAVIKNYINQLTENKSPVKISSSSGNRVATSVTLKPESLADAKKLVMDLFS